MAEFNFSLTDGNPDELAKLNKTLNWLMANLDHDNVTRLYTEYCSIQSENGETVIDGPLLKMTGGTTTIRLKMGKEGNDFIFALYNNLGVQTVGLNSSGNIISDYMTANHITVLEDLVVSGVGTINPSITLDVDGQYNTGTKMYIGPSNRGSTWAEYDTLNIYVKGSTSTSYPGRIYITGRNPTVKCNVDINGSLLSNGSLSVDRIKGYSNSDVIYFGPSGCHMDVGGGDVRIKNSGGAYLAISGSNLIYYNSAGTPTVIV